MAAIKISTLTAKTVPVAADSFVIVDSAAADNKKVSYSDLRSTILDAETTINESGADVDFRVESDTKTHALFVQGSDGFVGINKAAPTSQLDVVGNTSLDGAVTINETGADVDFRVEGVGESNALFVQGSDGFVGIGTGAPTRALEIAGSNATPSSNISALFGDGIIAGKTYIGRWSTNSTYAGLYHSGSNSSTDYILIQSAGGTTFLNAHTGGSINFRLDNNETVVINNATTTTLEVSGNIGFTNNGDGIDFGNVSGGVTGSSSSTVLNDYEEGTWTPNVYGNLSAGTPTYSSIVGTYTKIGNRVYITARIGVSGFSGAAGAMRMAGLPFAPSGSVNEYSALSVSPFGLTTTHPFLHAYIDNNNDEIVFTSSDGTPADAALGIDTSFTLTVTGFYRV